jgi:hypothetical protein
MQHHRWHQASATVQAPAETTDIVVSCICLFTGSPQPEGHSQPAQLLASTKVWYVIAGEWLAVRSTTWLRFFVCGSASTCTNTRRNAQ